MPLNQLTINLTRDFTANTNTNQCHSGSDAVSNDIVEVGGELTVKEKVERWRWKIANNRQATGNLGGHYIDLSYTPGSCSSRKWCNHGASKKWSSETLTGSLVRLTGTLACPLAPVGSIDSSANALALTRFAGNIRDAQGSFRGSTFVAELADTLRGIRNPAGGIRNLLDYYHARSRRNVRKAMRRDPLNSRVRDLSPGQAAAGTRALSDSWLELQFGVLPLMSDLRSAAKAYNRFSGREPFLSVKGSGERSDVAAVVQKAQSSQNIEARTYIHNRSDFSVRYYGAVKLRGGNFYTSLAEESGFQIRDFVPALWEWIPYSFLVDYFTNIGDLLESASISRADVAWMARTWLNATVRDGSRQTAKPLNSFVYPTSNAIEILGYSPSRATWRRTVFRRSPYTGSLVPSLQVEIPGFAGSKKWLNIAALLRLRGMRR